MTASFVWQPGPTGGTPTSAANLNRLAVTADIGAPGTPTGDALGAAYTTLNDPRLRKVAADLREFGTGVGVGNSTADTAALTAAWAALTGTSSGRVPSSPSDQYDISQSVLLLPPGSITYDGTGLTDTAVSGFVGRFAIRGAHQGSSEIRLAPGARLFDIASAALTRFELCDFQVRGGAGLFRHMRTANNIFGDMVFRRLVLRDYTECAIEYNSQNMPYVTVEGCVFRGHDTLSTMGIALSGIANGSQISRNRFLLNRVHVKLRRGGSDVYIDGNDFLRFATDRTGGPCVDLWLTPDTSASISATNGDGAGTNVTRSNKMGNENFLAGDYKILIADEDTATGSSNGSYWPTVATASTGNIENLTVQPQVYGAGSALRSPIVSTTPNLYGLDVAVQHRGGTSLPPYIVELTPPALAAAGPDPYRRSNRFSIQGRGVGVDQIVQASNLAGLGTVVDPSLQMTPLAEGGESAPEYSALFAGTTGVAGWTSGGGSSKSGISDSYGTGDGNAIEITMVAGSTLTGSLSSGAMTPGHRHWIEFVLRPGSVDSMPQVGFRVLDTGGTAVLQHILRVPTDGRPYQVRIPFVPLTAGGTAQFYVVNAATDLPNTTSSSGRFRVEWMAGYQGREPIGIQPRRTALALLAGLRMKTGTADARAGRGTLVSGTVVISTTAVTNNSLIVITPEGAVAGASGMLRVIARTAGASFTVTSKDFANGTVTNDTSSFSWALIEPTS